MQNLKISLVIQALDRATAPIRKIGTGMKWMEERAEHLKHALHKIGLAEFVGAAFFTGALVEGARSLSEMVTKTAELGEAAELSSQKLGMPVEEVQRLGYAASMAGVDMDAISTSMALFSFHIGRAAVGSKNEMKALRALGIVIKDVHHRLKPTSELFKEAADGFHRMHDGPVKMMVAMAMFGRSGREIIPLLNKGREQIEAWGDEAQRSGAIMDKEFTEKAADHLRQLKRLQLAIRGVKTQVSERLMGPLAEFYEKMTAAISKTQPELVKQLTDALSGLIAQLPQFIQFATAMIQIFSDLAQKILPIISNAKVLKGIMWGLAIFFGGQFVVAAAEMVAGLMRIAEALKIVQGIAAAGALFKIETTAVSAGAAAAGIFQTGGAVAAGTGAGAASTAAVGGPVTGMIALALGTAAILTKLQMARERVKNPRGVAWQEGVERYRAKEWHNRLEAVKRFIEGNPKAASAGARPSIPGARPAASSNAPPVKHEISATITVRAEPGTKVSNVTSSSGNVDLRVHRGALSVP